MRRLPGAARPRCLTEFGGGQFSSFKNALVELCVAKLAPIASEMKRLVADPGHVDPILIDGADRARAIAAETMKRDQGHRRLHPQALRRIAHPEAVERESACEISDRVVLSTRHRVPHFAS